MTFTFDNTFVRELDGLFVPWQAAQAPAPELLALNTDLAAELGVERAALRSPRASAMLVGNVVPDGADRSPRPTPATSSAGFSPRLGDGRALLLGEVSTCTGAGATCT